MPPCDPISGKSKKCVVEKHSDSYHSYGNHGTQHLCQIDLP